MANNKGRNNKLRIGSRKEQKRQNSVLKTKFKIWGLANSANQIKRIRSFLEPHAPRALRTAVFFVLVIIFSSRIYGLLLPQSPFERAKANLLTNSNDLSARLILADELLKNNQLEEVKHELAIVDSIRNSSSLVLGASSWLDEIIAEYKESTPIEINKLIAFWENIVNENPGYRDGFIKLSVYYYKIGNLTKAREYLEKAKNIDPNFKAIGELESLYNKTLR